MTEKTAKSEKTSKICKKCNKSLNSVNEIEFCDKCFIDVVFKRIRKFLRSEAHIYKAHISKGDSILVIDELTKKILPEIINTPINVKFKAVHFNGLDTKETRKLIETSKTSNQKIIIPLCLDDIETQYLAHIFSGKPTKFKFKLDPSFIPLYISLTKEELTRLAKLHRVEFVYINEPINYFLDKLEQEFPGTKFNIKKSVF